MLNSFVSWFWSELPDTLPPLSHLFLCIRIRWLVVLERQDKLRFSYLWAQMLHRLHHLLPAATPHLERVAGMGKLLRDRLRSQHFTDKSPK